MTTSTPHEGYIKWSGSDAFDPNQLASNWDKVDAVSGTRICTSSTRPTTWTLAQTGKSIYETDSGLTWRWNGSAFVRTQAVGFLGSSQRASSLVSTTSYQTVCQSQVTVPSGTRNVEISVTWGDPTALLHLALYRDAAMMAEWHVANTSGGKTLVDLDPVDGIITYALKVKNDGTAATLTGSTYILSTILVKEI